MPCSCLPPLEQHMLSCNPTPLDTLPSCINPTPCPRSHCHTPPTTHPSGPPANASQVHQMYRVLAKQFPAAELVASTFDDYVGQLEAAAPGLDLEVFTGEGYRGFFG